ncbi:hypothetical protein MSG28_007329 [Choristoneura fumiferana]|uniref:Uncharacterized protein n=1 Tax=Choristoneura fumiferana TaxID=7141 RepID=A0ACC0JX81_CHOFU|nr:hypothetical protein MSG28_007329 [Choristoneura fumiferana]
MAMATLHPAPIRVTRPPEYCNVEIIRPLKRRLQESSRMRNQWVETPYKKSNLWSCPVWNIYMHSLLQVARSVKLTIQQGHRIEPFRLGAGTCSRSSLICSPRLKKVVSSRRVEQLAGMILVLEADFLMIAKFMLGDDSENIFESIFDKWNRSLDLELGWCEQTRRATELQRYWSEFYFDDFLVCYGLSFNYVVNLPKNRKSSSLNGLDSLKETYALDFGVAFVACGRDVLFETKLAVQLAVLLYKANVLERAPTGRVDADEVLRTPDAAQSCYEWAPRRATSGALEAFHVEVLVLYADEHAATGVSLRTGSAAASGCGTAGAPSATRPSGSTWWQPTGMLGRCGGAGASDSGTGVCVPVSVRGGGALSPRGGDVPGAPATRGVRDRDRCERCRQLGVPVRATLARE